MRFPPCPRKRGFRPRFRSHLFGALACVLAGPPAAANAAERAADAAPAPAREVVAQPAPLDAPSFRKPQFRRGDANADGSFDISDPVHGLNFLFGAGIRPSCAEAANANGDDKFDVSDAVYSLNFMFRGGPVLPAPGSFACGVHPGESSLGCESYDFCPDDLPLITHVLDRITFGPTLDLLTRIQTRADLIDYIEEQLDGVPEPYSRALHEPAVEQRVDSLEIGFRTSPRSANAQFPRLEAMLLVDAIESRWQLLQVITHFWNNHFHTQVDALQDNFFRTGGRGGSATRASAQIFEAADADSSGDLTEEEWNAFRALHPGAIEWNDFNRMQADGLITLAEFLERNQVGYWKYRGGREQQAVAADMERREYELFHRLAFGSFRDLLEANAKSVAELIYLNGYENTVLAPNENYAREYFELISLGVDHVYTQRDIEELAKILTGWTVDWVRRDLYAADDINFQGHPEAEAFPINLREPRPLNFPLVDNWDDATYTWAFVFGHRNTRVAPLDTHDWERKDLFLQRFGGVDSLGDPTAPGDAVAIAANASDRSVIAALEEFDRVLDRTVAFRDCAKFISSKLIQLLVTDDLSALARTGPMPAELEARYLAIDTDGDGIEPSEWEEPIPLVLPNGRPPEVFDRLDADSDGIVTRLEYREPDLLLAAIDAWRSSDGSIREVLRTILLSDEFLSLKFYRAKVKSPFEVVTSASRLLGGTMTLNQLLQATNDLALAGMDLMNFPDPTGESELGFDWVHTIGLLERLKFLNRAANPLNGSEQRLTWIPTGFDTLFQLDTAQRTVDFLTLLLLSGDILPEHRELALQAYASVDTRTARVRATAAYLLSLPQFQKQ